MSEEEFEREMQIVEKENESLGRIAQLKKERNRYRKSGKKITTSKLALLAMFIIVIEIVAFTQFMMFTTQDLSALYVLIGIPATMIVPLWKYYSKSEAENTRGGIVYDTAMIQKDAVLDEDDQIIDFSPGYDPVEDLDVVASDT